jgi:serralysin
VKFGASATATVTGSGNTISAATGDHLTVSSDTVNVAASATATLTGNSNTINAGKSDTLTVTGNSSDAFVFIPAFGIDTINGFASTDQMTFSTSDFANWSALQSHMSQSGANTVITLDAFDKITLTNVTMSSLQSSQFHFQ